MSQVDHSAARLRAATIAALAAAAVVAPGQAFANRPGGSNFGSTVDYWGCFFGGGNPAYCKQMAKVEDPPADGVTSLHLELAFDPSKYAFDAAASGPLTPFATGGDNPPVSPGVGTEPFQALPVGGITPGAPLPGSTLTFTVTPGLLTVDYALGSAVTASGDVNDLLLVFDLVHPRWIDFPASSVTYFSSGPGADFTKLAESCTTLSGLGCGSDFPTSGETVNYVYATGVPEPAGWSVLLLGFLGLGAVLRRARGRSHPMAAA
jgi:hypothetical protein